MKNSLLNKFLGFTFLILAARVYTTGHFSFVFMLWNLFLAWLPLYFLKWYHRKSGALKITLLLTAVLFLPNAPYMTTDLFHLSKDLAAPLWLDTIMLLNFAILGLAFFVIAAHHILELVKIHFNSVLAYRVIKVTLLFACGYGIYLGRYLRFNSWDIISNPVNLTQGIIDSWFLPGHFKETFAISLSFAVFLYLILESCQQYVFRSKTIAGALSQEKKQSI